jgi:ABC-type Co2+ transport system permease subunit
MAETGSSDAAAVRILPPLVPLTAVLVGVILQMLIPLPRGPMGTGRAHVWIGGLILVAAITLGDLGSGDHAEDRPVTQSARPDTQHH